MRVARGADPEAAPVGADRACRLMVEWCGASVLSGVIEVGGPPPRRRIELRTSRAAARIGYPVSTADAVGVFERRGGAYRPWTLPRRRTSKPVLIARNPQLDSAVCIGGKAGLHRASRLRTDTFVFLRCPSCSAWTRRQAWMKPVRFTIACPECGTPCDVSIPEVRVLPPDPAEDRADDMGSRPVRLN